MKTTGRKGSAFIIVVGVLGVILFASTMFMSSTIEEGRQTSLSVRGLHAASLAEASLERAMRMLADEINDVNPETVSADALAIKLRLPARVKSGVTLGLAGNLGEDEQLELDSLALFQIPEAFAPDRGVMDENVRPFLPCDESVPLGSIEPFDGSDYSFRHVTPFRTVC